MNKRVVLAGLALALGATAAWANTAGGTVNAGRDGQGFANDFASAWNDNSEFVCTSNSPFKVKAISGPCDWGFVTTAFDVNSGGSSNAAHTFVYEINCAGTVLTHTVAWDGGMAENIDTTVKVFNLSGGDTITVTTTRSSVRAPAYRPWTIAVLAGLLGLGILYTLRRRTLPSRA